MNSLDKIRKYINTIKIRKSMFGGYDREDVYMKMNELVEIFRDYVKEELENHDNHHKSIERELAERVKEIEEYKKKLHESQALVVELNMKLNEITAEQVSTLQEMEKQRITYKNYCANILDQYSGSLHTLSTEFTKILENITVLQQNILELDNLENLSVSVDEIEEKELLELPDLEIDLDIDIDEWLYGEDKDI